MLNQCPCTWIKDKEPSMTIASVNNYTIHEKKSMKFRKGVSKDEWITVGNCNTNGGLEVEKQKECESGVLVSILQLISI